MSWVAEKKAMASASSATPVAAQATSTSCPAGPGDQVARQA